MICKACAVATFGSHFSREAVLAAATFDHGDAGQDNPCWFSGGRECQGHDVLAAEAEVRRALAALELALATLGPKHPEVRSQVKRTREAQLRASALRWEPKEE